jgi:hypothetical protein
VLGTIKISLSTKKGGELLVVTREDTRMIHCNTNGASGRLDAENRQQFWRGWWACWSCLFVFCTFERLLRSVRVESDGRSRGAVGVREAGWLDSVVTTDNRGKGAKRH